MCLSLKKEAGSNSLKRSSEIHKTCQFYALGELNFDWGGGEVDPKESFISFIVPAWIKALKISCTSSSSSHGCSGYMDVWSVLICNQSQKIWLRRSDVKQRLEVLQQEKNQRNTPLTRYIPENSIAQKHISTMKTSTGDKAKYKCNQDYCYRSKAVGDKAWVKVSWMPLPVSALHLKNSG